MPNKNKRGQCSLKEIKKEDSDEGYYIIPTISERSRNAVASAIYEVVAHPDRYESLEEEELLEA